MSVSWFSRRLVVWGVVFGVGVWLVRTYDNFYPYTPVVHSFSRVHRLYPDTVVPPTIHLSSEVASDWHVVAIFMVGDYRKALLEKNKTYHVVSPGDKVSEDLTCIQILPRTVIIRSSVGENSLVLSH